MAAKLGFCFLLDFITPLQIKLYKNQSLTARFYSRHGHLDENCPEFPNDPLKRFTKRGTSYELENHFQQEQIAYLKKKYNVNKVTIEWECVFQQVLDGDNEFTREILPDLIFFNRMTAREAMFPGWFFYSIMWW